MLWFAAWVAFFPLHQTFLISSFDYSLIFISSLTQLGRKSSGFLIPSLSNSSPSLTFLFLRFTHACDSQRSCWFIFVFVASLRCIRVNIIDRGFILCCCCGCCLERKEIFSSLQLLVMEVFSMPSLLSFDLSWLFFFVFFFSRMTDLCCRRLHVRRAERNAL